jgi:hypothetical protein
MTLGIMDNQHNDTLYYETRYIDIKHKESQLTLNKETQHIESIKTLHIDIKHNDTQHIDIKHNDMQHI